MKRTDIEQLLPEIMRRTLGAGKPMDAILGVMEDMHAPAEDCLARIELYFNPYDTQPRFVPYLASWLDLERFFDVSGSEPVSTGRGRLRELIARAAYLSQWRGTRRGLVARIIDSEKPAYVTAEIDYEPQENDDGPRV